VETTLEVNVYELTLSFRHCMVGTDSMNGNSGKLFKILIHKMY
jgi:hypothetical protein